MNSSEFQPVAYFYRAKDRKIESNTSVKNYPAFKKPHPGYRQTLVRLQKSSCKVIGKALFDGKKVSVKL